MTTTTAHTTEKVVPHLTVAERVARGKQARAEVPRSSHAAFEAPSNRPDPVALLEIQAQTRVPELVPIRYGRMLVSPFAFYRGAAKIMATDLAWTPRSGMIVQCCGDAHLSNFGVFASPERRLVFDINDFDETLPGPWEWDVKRLATSMLIAARDNSYGVKDQDRIVLDTIGAYRAAMRDFAGQRTLEVWYARLEIESVLKEYGSQFESKMVKRTERALAKAQMIRQHALDHGAQIGSRCEITILIQARRLQRRPVRNHAAALDRAAGQQCNGAGAVIGALGAVDARGPPELGRDHDRGVTPMRAEAAFEFGQRAIQA